MRPRPASLIGETIRTCTPTWERWIPGSPALEALVEAAGADRVMFGTDWPHFAQGQDMAARIAAVRTPGRFSPDTAARILGGNALDFMKGGPPGLTPRR